ncbi:MAG: hypothetical protein U9Q83_05780, partial [Bacteroidota bacterium]|nr:hypothetical protein [Bacteroidota bacterium]
MKKLFVLLIVLIAFSSVNAQLLIDSEFRSTFQALHGWKKPVLANTDALLNVNQRSRIIFNYNSDKVKTRFTIQDTRIWGSGDLYNSTGVVTNTNSLGVHEAWAEIVTGKSSSLRIGR